MTLQTEKQQIIDILNKLLSITYIKEYSRVYNGLQVLKKEITEDFYTVVVLGEFNRGKSSLVNALLNAKILPMDVLPETATINAIMYDENPRLSVMLRDGKERIGEFSEDFMRLYSAKSSLDELENVSYIKIGYPCNFLKKRVVLVDTPGVSDLNEHRSEVTYNFIPKANAVIFVLDANSPLKKTEMDFIKERLIPCGITNILFVINKFDNVDEEEDPDFFPQVRKRLLNIFQSDEQTVSLNEISVLPFSAKWAMEGQEKENDRLLYLSRIDELQEKINSMLLSNNVERGKVDGYKKRLYYLLSTMKDDLEYEYNICSATIEELLETVEILNRLLLEKKGQAEKLTDYVNSAKKRIYALSDKSLLFFHKKLRENLISLVEEYHSQDFKRFVEIVVQQQIKRNIEDWLVTYIPHVDELLAVVEHELGQGLSRYFEQQVKLRAENRTNLQQINLKLNLQSADLSQTGLQAGVITTAGALAVTLAFSPLLVPLVTMWGRSKLFENILSKKLEVAKTAVIPQLESEISKAIMMLMEHVHDYIDKRIESITNNTKYAYESLLENLRNHVDVQVMEKHRTESDMQKKLTLIKNHIHEIQEYLDELCTREIY